MQAHGDNQRESQPQEDQRDARKEETGGEQPESASGAHGVYLADLFALPHRKTIAASPDALTTAVREAASKAARSLAEMFAWLDAADQNGVWQTWFDIRSFAHWIAFVCQVSAHTAREYARCIRGLRDMPEVATYFYDGRLSYSKVRAVTRLAGRVDSAEAAEFARVMRTNQLELTVSTWVALDDANQADQHDDEARREDDLNSSVRNVPWLRSERVGDGRTRLTIELDDADAADVLARIQTRRDSLIRAHRDTSTATPSAAGTTGDKDRERCVPTQIDALLDIFNGSTETSVSAGHGATDVRSESTVVVHVSTDVLAAACTHTRDGRSQPKGENVPAGTPHNDGGPADADNLPEQVGHTDGFGPVTRATVGRLTCNSGVVGAVIDEHGAPLALGRTKRLASRRQRLALRARDLCCQFPGCIRTVGIEVHYIRTWADGGPTDMDNMVQLCRAHHVTVHTRELRIRRTDAAFTGACAGTGMTRANAGPAFRFYTSDCHEITAEASWDDDIVLRVCAETDPTILDVASGRIRPPVGEGPNRMETAGSGEGFNLEWCVWALFDLQRNGSTRSRSTQASFG